ncbi:MAG: TIGR03618 family F420-dependent PPOX class oxidoreductase [Dehalococcoidia bacterium]|nr:TIGR03618 family F420-dependent PPOX class oxidoreductase [Dehalococcoidia bacterium]
MTNARARIQLTEAEQRELFAQSRILQVASINPDGTPHLVPMWFEVDDEGVLAFTTYGTSQKVRNLERDPRLTVLLETGDAYNELRGASIDAEAEVVRDPQRTARVLALVGAKYAGRPRPEAAAIPEPPPAAYKRVTIRVHPRRVRTWDHRKLG